VPPLQNNAATITPVGRLSFGGGAPTLSYRKMAEGGGLEPQGRNPGTLVRRPLLPRSLHPPRNFYIKKGLPFADGNPKFYAGGGDTRVTSRI
jgi:hypothetical protein